MNPLFRLAVAAVPFALALFVAASGTMATGANGSIVKSPYGTTSSGSAIDQYTLTGANGLEVKIITYGGIVTSVQNRKYKMPDIVLGFSNLHDYETLNSPGPHFGALIGRYANRIANGVFTLDGVTYCLDANNGPNTLHGGFKGFDTKLWTVTKVIDGSDGVGIEIHYLSPAGDGWTNTAPNPNCPPDAVKGFPGNLDTHVTFTVTKQNQLVINYRAITDAATVVNLTNHSYWNLSGEGTGTIYSDLVRLNADSFTPVNSSQIPDGTIKSVTDTVLDFRKAKAVSEDIRDDDPQIASGNGFDLNWVVNPPRGHNPLSLAATVTDPDAGRTLNVWTDQPGIQLYTGNSLDGSLHGTSNRAYRQSDALALETQHYPDSPNHANFPSTELRPGQTYATTTIFEIRN
jgi:aldose 1-epimerase